MAETPQVNLSFQGICPDCGTREVTLPAALPPVGDDFDWLVRDYDGFRIFMFEELAARFPERQRWTPADLEVVLVEVFAAMLDMLSDMLDRVAAEAFLESARRPETVRLLLGMIGYDAVGIARERKQIPNDATGDAASRLLESYWQAHPSDMERARREGPRLVHTQKRMVTVEDYALRLLEHPLVLQAHAWEEWGGSWPVVRLAAIVWNDTDLDSAAVQYPDDLRASITGFHARFGIPVPDLNASPSIRTVLRPYVDALRMAGQQVVLQGPVYIGIYLAISVKVAANYFRSEIRHAIDHVLGRGAGGYFEPGRRSFGEDLFASDIIQALMALDGVEHVCLNRFKRLGSQYPDCADSGVVRLDGLEVAVCDNDPSDLQHGFYRLKLEGGLGG